MAVFSALFLFDWAFFHYKRLHMLVFVLTNSYTIEYRKGKSAARRRRKVMGLHARVGVQADRQTAEFFVRRLFYLRTQRR
jgi:hypothetical protein